MGRYMVCRLFIMYSNVTWVDMDRFRVCNFFLPRVLIGQGIFNYSLR